MLATSLRRSSYRGDVRRRHSLDLDDRPGNDPGKLLLWSSELYNRNRHDDQISTVGIGLAAVVATAAAAQAYYPNYYPGYSYSYPGYHPTYSYPTYGYPYSSYYGSSYYGSPYSYPAPAYRPAPAYSDPYVAARHYSDSTGRRASGHVGY